MKTDMLDTPEAKKIRKACTRFLTHDYPKTPRQVLSELVEMTDPELEADHYGRGEIINELLCYNIGKTLLSMKGKFPYDTRNATASTSCSGWHVSPPP
jgi:hypothetical protein